METTKVETEEPVLQDKIENLIAIGAAMAANCIPCYEYLYKKAINSGNTSAEFKRASDIGGQVKPKICRATRQLMNLVAANDEYHQKQYTDGFLGYIRQTL